MTLEVNASGGGLSYQWFVSSESHGGPDYTGYHEIPGATSPILIDNIGEQRDFYCYVHNSPGAVSTAPIHVDVDVSPPLEVVYENWLAEFLTPTQLANPAFTDMEASPADDGVTNLLKFALNLDPTTPAKNEEILQLNTPASDSVTLTFVLDLNARNAGLTTSLVQSSGLKDIWNPVSVVEETVGDKIFVSATIEINRSRRSFSALKSAGRTSPKPLHFTKGHFDC
ncbi:MAG: hypothetical protein ACON4R_09175 [Akkermansiaceae bacterium]